MPDDLAAARALLPGSRLRVLDTLRSGERATVWRVGGAFPDRAEQTVVVKQFHQAGEGWTRELAALSVLPGGHAPEVLAAGAAPPVLVMQDFGGAGNLADALLGPDPAAAATAVHAWAEALARLHVATRGSRSAFTAALDRHAGDLLVADSRVWVELDDAVRVLDQHCGALGVAVPGGALDRLRDLGHRLGADGLAALSPADTCPDNNVWVDGRFALLDFEGAQWRHVAWDLAYLAVPWPTCWCSWRLPDEVRDRALDAYRTVAASAWPQVADDAFARDLDAAVVGWALTSTTWFLTSALGADEQAAPDPRVPSRRAMIRHRLGVARACAELPELAELAGNLDDVLAQRWGATPLGLAPAFRHATEA